MDPLLRVDARSDENLLVVAGELDAATCDLLDGHIDALGEDGPVVLDMSGITFVDSSGLRSLVQARRTADGGITLRNPSPVLVRLLELSGLSAAFEVDAPPSA